MPGQHPVPGGGPWASRGEAEDLGEYVILSKAVVSSQPRFSGEKDAVAKVEVGARVKVLEIQNCDEDRRIRGRLKRPSGWISLVNTETGRRWAAKMVLCPERHALQRICAGRMGCCSLCGGTYVRGSFLLECEQCSHIMCMRCLKTRAPLQAWTFNVTAGVRVNELGTQFNVTPSMRVWVSGVEPGSWADRVGVRPCDEVTAINGVNVDRVTQQELKSVLARSRPLEFTVVYNGPESAPPPGSAGAGASSSVAVAVSLQGLDFARLSADAQLFKNFKSILRHCVVAEAGHGVLREDVELRCSEGSPLTVHCVVNRLSEANAEELCEQLDNSPTLGAAVTLALNRMPQIRSVATSGPISVVAVELEQEGGDKEDARCDPTTPRTQPWPHFMGTRTFLKRLGRTPSPSPTRTRER